MQLIALADVLQLMDTTADPFDVVYVSADRKRRTGGELVALRGCLATGRPDEPAPASAPPVPEPTNWRDVVHPRRRRPAHRAHQTRNVTILSSGHTRKLHVRLIVEFNGQTVRW